MIPTLLTNMPKIEEDLTYIPPYMQTILISLLVIGAILFIGTVLTVMFGDILSNKTTILVNTQIVGFIVCFIAAFFLFVYRQDNAKHAFQDKQYSLIREKSTLTIQSESKYLETKNFQIIGEDETHLFLKHDDKLYEFHYKENIQQKD